MTTQVLKKALRTPESGAGDTHAMVERMLRDIEQRRELAVREYAQKLDAWTGDFVVTAAEIARAEAALSGSVKDDLRFAKAQVQAFACKQRESMQEFETELYPGLITGSD